MAGLKYSKVIKYKIRAVCRGPLHIGNANGGKEEVLIDSVTRMPFIQASSLAGVFRSTYAKNHSEEEVDTLFGASKMNENENSADKKSRVVFTDGQFETQNLKIEIRPHVKIDRETGSVTSSNNSGQKFNMEYVGAGAVINTYVYVYDNEELSLAEEFESVLASIKAEEISIGAKKSSGAGKLSLEYVGKKVFNLMEADDRKLWLDEESLDEKIYNDITNELNSETKIVTAYKVVISGQTEGAILVKGIGASSFGKDAPDAENIKNAKDEYIVPGSSYRGAIKSQMEKIAAYIDKKSVIDKSFGFVGKKQNDSAAGNMIFNDGIIQASEQDTDVLRHRIHIDKFTGGVMHGGLFSEKNASGKIELEIDVLDKNNPKATLGLLMMALRDLSIKTINLGSGYATGKGFIDVNSIEITSGSGNVKITFEEGNADMTDENGIIKEALAALKEVS